MIKTFFKSDRQKNRNDKRTDNKRDIYYIVRKRESNNNLLLREVVQYTVYSSYNEGVYIKV